MKRLPNEEASFGVRAVGVRVGVRVDERSKPLDLAGVDRQILLRSLPGAVIGSRRVGPTPRRAEMP